MNVPVAMANVKCPSCATIWNVDNPGAAQISADAKQQKQLAEAAVETDSGNKVNFAIIGGLVAAGMVLLGIIGVSVMLISQTPAPSEIESPEAETIKPRIPEPYREVDLPESERMAIYADYRAVAKTTVEKALILPQGTRVRKNLEVMLEKTYDRELVHFSLLHNIEVEDVLEIIKEGDAKVWDDSPRSHAVRDGKRVYAEEMSEGWKKSPNSN
ncbi:hypothetical protein [Rubripirellula reticaptiva]|uniref:hypothetical protein n=1 Tax=Rubripirellula reticaptiva TaxID=2528013 RepID=UPI00164760CB|nr:hypothetical protein [Rubripirellula reticaptiva]